MGVCTDVPRTAAGTQQVISLMFGRSAWGGGAEGRERGPEGEPVKDSTRQQWVTLQKGMPFFF